VCTSPYKHSPHTRATAKGFGLLGLTLLVVARAVAADPCPAADPKDALQLADRLFDQGSYRLAGECYRYSGRYDRANRAFAAAARVSAISGSRELSQDAEQAKAQWQHARDSLRRMR
jgi:hypothetical protein